MLTIWRRHNKAKCTLVRRADKKCRCIIWMSGTLPSGERIRESTRLRDWTRAEVICRRREVEGALHKITRATLAEWRDNFMQDARVGRNLNSETLRKYSLLFRQLDEFAADKGLRFVNQLDLATLTEFRASWKDAPLSALKKLERLRSVLKFALHRKWIEDNPAKLLSAPKIVDNPTLPFAKEEMQRILKAATRPTADPRIHAFILVMRHAGLRISDTTALAVSSLQGNRIQLRQAKTREHVYVPIPAKVSAALRRVPHKNPRYFFWSGTSKLPAAISVWRKRLAQVFKEGGIRKGHSHRFRDTFSVELLEGGLSVESLSNLLGHRNIKVTQKHYSPWVKTRQAALDAEVRLALKRRGAG